MTVSRRAGPGNSPLTEGGKTMILALVVVLLALALVGGIAVNPLLFLLALLAVLVLVGGGRRGSVY
jgi:hypothetical protein